MLYISQHRLSTTSRTGK